MRYTIQTVAKKTKIPTKDTENGSVPAALAPAALTEKAPRRAAVKSKKGPAKRGVKRSKTTAPTPSLPSEEEIRIRAYFISERRHRLALPGDATSDWEEARRQLLSELGPR